jgi:hypothetical protein
MAAKEPVKIKYVGPFDAVDVPALGQTVNRRRSPRTVRLARGRQGERTARAPGTDRGLRLLGGRSGPMRR